MYGRRPILVLTILGYSLFTGLTGFAQGPLQLLIFTSITRITLQGETPVGMIMVSETAPTTYAALMDKEHAAMIFTDPPYNVPIDGHASGLGAIRHRPLPMASGEMNEAEYTAFLAQGLSKPRCLQR